MTADPISDLAAYTVFGGILTLFIGMWRQRRTGHRINLFTVLGAATIAFVGAQEGPGAPEAFSLPSFATLFVAICFLVMVIFGPRARRTDRNHAAREQASIDGQLRQITSRIAICTRDLPDNARDNHVLLHTIDRDVQRILALLIEHPKAAKDPFLTQELRGCAALLQSKGIRDPLLIARFQALYEHLHRKPSGLRLLRNRPTPPSAMPAGTQLISHTDPRRF